MTKLSPIAASLMAAAIFVVACSSDSDSLGSTLSQSVVASYAQTFCARVQKCPSIFSLEVVYGDVSTCVSETTARTAFELEFNGTNITDAQFSACTSALAAADCSLEQSTLPACQFKGGTVPTGQGCALDQQCASGHCLVLLSATAPDPSTVTTGYSCGSCEPLSDVAGDCSSDPDCKTGLTCDPSTRTCATAVAKGAACTLGGVSCVADETCIKSVCADRVAAGGACNESEDDCVDGYDCASGTCVVATAPQIASSLAEIGQPCDELNPTNPSTCKHSTCVGPVGNQKCVAYATEGQSCTDITTFTASGDVASSPACAALLFCQNGRCAKDDARGCP